MVYYSLSYNLTSCSVSEPDFIIFYLVFGLSDSLL